MRSLFLKCGLAATLALGLAPSVLAQYRDVTLTAHKKGVSTESTSFIYDNSADFSGSAYAAGGSAAISGNTITKMVMDDITFPAGYAGSQVIRMDFFVVNLNTVAVSARPRMRFWLPDGANGGPGTYYNNNGLGDFGFTFNPISFPANSVSGFFTTFDPDPMSVNYFPFKVPTGGKFYIGVTFDNNVGATGATAAQLNNLGVGLFGVPISGSSDDVFFQTTNPGSFFQVSNPPGGFISFGHDTDPTKPLANAGYAFAVDLTGRTISGNILLEGNPPLTGIPPVGETLTLEFKIGGVTQFTQNVTLGANGAFTTDATAANYTITIKGSKWLAKNIPADLTSGNITNVAVTLKAGDANDDNTVDINDLLLLIAHYNNNPTYLAAADFNGDGANDITDLLLIVQNYNQIGD